MLLTCSPASELISNKVPWISFYVGYTITGDNIIIKTAGYKMNMIADQFTASFLLLLCIISVVEQGKSIKNLKTGMFFVTLQNKELLSWCKNQFDHKYVEICLPTLSKMHCMRKLYLWLELRGSLWGTLFKSSVLFSKYIEEKKIQALHHK